MDCGGQLPLEGLGELGELGLVIVGDHYGGGPEAFGLEGCGSASMSAAVVSRRVGPADRPRVLFPGPGPRGAGQIAGLAARLSIRTGSVR